jgi:RNA polymerase sigma factor (sigma-70 family)
VRWRHIRGAPEPYARKALTNLVANRWRSRGRRPEVALVDQHDRPDPDSADGFAIRDQLLVALQDLPPRQRAVLVLRYYEDLTEVQTAEVLGCSVGTVKSQASRALGKLRLSTEPVEGLR